MTHLSCDVQFRLRICCGLSSLVYLASRTRTIALTHILDNKDTAESRTWWSLVYHSALDGKGIATVRLLDHSGVGQVAVLVAVFFYNLRLVMHSYGTSFQFD